MKLTRAEFKNFRSISDLKLSFEPMCRILIGINESGKSNILRALHLLDPKVPVQASDLRIELLDEPQVTNGWVRFVFDLSEEESSEVTEKITKHVEKNSLSRPLFQTNEGILTASEWAKRLYQGLHIVTLPTGKRSNTSWSANSTFELAPGWVRNKSTEPCEITIGESKITIAPSMFVWIGDPTVTMPDALEPATIGNLYSMLGEQIGEIVSRELPLCIFWKYSDQYLLPSTVDINTFCADPNSCIPLKSMFELAGYDVSKLLETITKARQQGHYRYSQILEKAGNAATQHIRNIWKDYRSVRLRLEPNGDALSPVVTDDQVPLDMANRSDGFKRFVSFLLQISAKVRTAELKNALILVDEPEIALHPSGCKHLLEELIKISESNATVFSTHSIFMIDKENIARHLVVEKKKEVTTVWEAEKSRIHDEEVLYSAMGYSVFETLKPKNVIFEGWRDKYIYALVSATMGKSDSKLKERMVSIGITHASGVKDIRHVAKFMELAGRPCLIISDADGPAIQYKRQYEEPTAWGKWVTLQDIFGLGPIVTAEDLLTHSAVIKRANKYRSSMPGLVAVSEEMLGGAQPTIGALTAWIQTAGINGQPLADAISNLKGFLFENLKRTEIKDEAEQLVRFVDQYDFE